MPFNKDIYRSYDIRGIVPAEFDPAEAYHIGRAYAQLTGAKRVVVARDMRESGDVIVPHLLKGLTEGGVDVVDIGLATTPLFYFAVHHLQADGGLSVTASHNPAQYNGVKITREKAIPVGGDSGLYEMRDLVEQRQWQPVTKVGRVSTASVKNEYLTMVTDDVTAAGLTIAADASNGMVGMLLADYFDRIGGNVAPLYWELDGRFPNHEADPLKEENLVDLKKLVQAKQADIGVIFDGDGDRAFFVTEKGDTVPGDIATALIAREMLVEQPGATFLYDLRASRATKEVIEEAGGRAVMSKVGHSNIKAQMRRDKAVFAGEVSGHFFFTPWYAESALLALGYILRAMKKYNQPLSEIVAPLNRYPKTPEINFEVTDKQAAMDRLKKTFQDGEILELDGVSIIYPTWWANVRPSNTEPLLRLNMEADTPELLREKQATIEQLITAA